MGNGQPAEPNKDMKLAEGSAPGIRERVIDTTKRYGPVARLTFFVLSLTLFLAWMPAQMRLVIWQGVASRGILSGMLLVFSLLALSLVWSGGQRFDVWAFLFFNLQGLRPLWLDRLMLGFTQIGSGLTAVAIGLILFAIGNRLFAYELVLGTLTLWIVVELLKSLVRRPRPVSGVPQVRIVGYPAGGRSFPSGHTSQAFFMATLMSHHFHADPWVVLLLYVLALLVGITRMYVGAHYPRDVLAGAILGSAWGLLGALVDEYLL